MRRKRKVRCVYIYDRFVLGAADTRENFQTPSFQWPQCTDKKESPKNLTKTFELGAKSLILK